MKYLIIFAACLFGASVSAVTAQDQGGNSADTTVVAVGNVDYELELNDPVQACVWQRTESAEGSTVDYRLFVLEDGVAYTVGNYHAPAEGAFATVQILECIGLRP
jgi:hypothetical protein